MKIMETINSFVDVMLEEQKNFENIQNEVNSNENDVQSLIENLKETERKLVESAKASMSDSSNEEIIKVFELSAKSLYSTMEEVNKQIQEEIKGKAFIEDFEKRFTVAVFGKVKAGKSYIGNFVMGNPLKVNGISSAFDKVEKISVNVYDRGTLSEQTSLSEQDDSDFATGMKETTSTIQWFELGGLSWFDTPGIGSITWENEMLAKEYVKNADLVIFACNSDAAGTRQEFAEMKQLYEAEKPILLLLTQSDVYESDIDDEGEEISILVPKSDKDRKDTENYMIDTLNEQGMSDLNKYGILTVSAKLAVESLKSGNEEMFVQSNMGLFLEKLVSITKTEAAELKKLTPKKRFNEMIDDIVVKLNNMAKEITEACSLIAEDKQSLVDREDNIVELIKSKVHMRVLSVINDFKVKIEKNSDTITEEELAEAVNKTIGDCIAEVCMDESLKGIERVNQLNIQLSGIGELKMKQDRIAYEHTVVSERERDPRSIGEHLGKILLKKKYYESRSHTETRYSTFDIGVNDADIERNITYKLDDVFRTTVSEFIESVVSGYYQPIEELQCNTVLEIGRTVKALSGLRL